MTLVHGLSCVFLMSHAVVSASFPSLQQVPEVVHVGGGEVLVFLVQVQPWALVPCSEPVVRLRIAGRACGRENLHLEARNKKEESRILVALTRACPSDLRARSRSNSTNPCSTSLGTRPKHVGLQGTFNSQTPATVIT